MRVAFSASTGVVSADDLEDQMITLTNSQPSATVQFTTSFGWLGTINYATVTARILHGNGYVLPIIETGRDRSQIAANIRDKKSKVSVPVERELTVSMAAVTNNVTEGQPFYLKFTPSKPPAQHFIIPHNSYTPQYVVPGLPINIRVSESGNLLSSETLSREEVLLTSGNPQNISFTSRANDFHIGENSTVTIELLEGPGYQIIGNTTATVTIEQVGNSEDLNYSISALSSYIKKGENARFQVSSNYSIRTERKIDVGVIVNPADLISNTDSREVTIPANSRTGELIIAVPEDSDTDLDSIGWISAYMLDDATTTEVNTQEFNSQSLNTRSAIVHVIDDELTTGISVIASKEEIDEGEFAPFYVVASEVSNVTRVISLSVSDGSSGRIDTNSFNYPQHAVGIPAGKSFVRLNIKTTENPTHSADATITVTLNPSNNNSYQLANATASIVVRDKNIPTISFDESEIAMSEFGSATFKIKPNFIPNSDIIIDLQSILVTVENNIHVESKTEIDGSLFTLSPTPIILNAQSPVRTVTITSKQAVDQHTSYLLSIKESVNRRYLLGEKNVLKVVVKDAPTASISPMQASVVEGEPAQFTITLDPQQSNTQINGAFTDGTLSPEDSINTKKSGLTTALVTVSFDKVGDNPFRDDIPVNEKNEPIFPFTRSYLVSGSETISIATRYPR